MYFYLLSQPVFPGFMPKWHETHHPTLEAAEEEAEAVVSENPFIKVLIIKVENNVETVAKEYCRVSFGERKRNAKRKK